MQRTELLFKTLTVLCNYFSMPLILKIIIFNRITSHQMVYWFRQSSSPQFLSYEIIWLKSKHLLFSYFFIFSENYLFLSQLLFRSNWLFMYLPFIYYCFLVAERWYEYQKHQSIATTKAQSTNGKNDGSTGAAANGWYGWFAKYDEAVTRRFFFPRQSSK